MVKSVSRKFLREYCRLVVPVITPCAYPGKICLKDMRNLCAFLAHSGTDALFLISSTGELPLLHRTDRAALIRTAREAAPDQILFAGVSGMGLKDTVENIRIAKENGADIAIAMAPFFFKYSSIELEIYCNDLADRSTLPIGFYNHIKLPTQFDIQLLEKINRHENIVAFKDTTGDPDRIEQMEKSVQGDGIALYQGSENLLLDGLRAGATGTIAALANVLPEVFRALIDAYLANDDSRAEKLQRDITEVWELFICSDVQASVSAFFYIIRHALMKRGVLGREAGMLAGYEPAPALLQRMETLIIENPTFRKYFQPESETSPKGL